MSSSYADLPGWHDIADAIFRRKAFLLISTGLLLVAVAAAWQLADRSYEAQMVLLVRNNRAEVVVSPGQTSGSMPQTTLSEGQIATEVQLLTGRSSLRQVVQRCNLQGSGPEGSSADVVDQAVQTLERELKVTPMVKANMIVIRYANRDPGKAAMVLRELLATYTDQHIRVHKGGGTDFFELQSGDQATRLRNAQGRLAAFQRDAKIVLLNEQKDLNLRRLMDLEAAGRESQLALREGRERIKSLQEMVRALTPRITTQVRNIPNQYLVERLNTMLAEMENKRIDLLVKFRSDDRSVKLVEQQIADTRATLERAAKLSSTERATDVNPLRQSLDADLARARTNQQGIQARMAALAGQIAEYKREIANLERATAKYNDLVREVKTLEENYQLYSRKWEESRIADALDRQKIANVTVVEAPEVPASTAPRSRLLPAGAILLGLFLVLCLAVISGIHGQALYTPQAIYQASGIPVLATVPETRWQR